MVRYVVTPDDVASAEVVDAVDEAQIGSVIFAVNSPVENECIVVAETISAVFNRFIHENFQEWPEDVIEGYARGFGDWSEDGILFLPEDHRYVYAYATPRNFDEWSTSEPPYRENLENYEVFYVGRGRNDRIFDHLRMAVGDLTGSSISEESGKIRRIQDFLLRQSLESGKTIARKICYFWGDFAHLKYAAVEHFLINYWCGVYTLENLTRGDEMFLERGSGQKSQCAWLCRPKTLAGGNVAWIEAVREFPARGRRGMRQSVARNICVAEVNSHFETFPIGFPELLNLTFANESRAISDGTDAFYSIVWRDSNDQAFLHLQLLLSYQETGVRVNFRRVKNDSLEGFIKKIGDVFFDQNANEARIYVRNAGSPYFKPFARAGNGRDDIFFDFRSPEKLYDLSGTHFARRFGINTPTSFPDIMRFINNTPVRP
jgi:hypothetical protein